MKKIICLILCVALSALVLVSCGKEEHVHQYNRDVWAADSTNHWHAADCGCDGVAPVDVAKHVYDKNNDEMDDGRCDICGAVSCDKTKYNTVYTENSVNAFSHWYAPECGHCGQNSHLPINVEAHDYVNGVCKTCNYNCVEKGHVDTEKDAEGNVKGSGTCDACKIVFCDGSYDLSKLVSDEAGHWYAATCTDHVHAKKDYKEHIDIKGATDDKDQPIADGFCDDCNHKMPEKEEAEG